MLLGWAVDIDDLKSPLLGQAAPRPNTAIGLILCGATLALVRGAPVPWRRHAAAVTAALVTLVGLVTLAEDIFAWDLGVNELVVAGAGRMTAAAALAFILLGASFLLTDRGRWGGALAQAAVLATGLLALTALMAYAYGAPVRFMLGSYTAMAPQTAAVLLLLALSAPGAQSAGPVAYMLGSEPGAPPARRLIFATGAVIVLIGLLLRWGEHAQVLDERLGFAVFTALTIVSVTGLIAWQARARAAEAELRQARTVADAANRAKDEFLANVSHEIRTPMNAILGLTELVLDTPVSQDQAQLLKTIGSAARSLLRIINDILDFSKIEAGKLELDPTDVSLRAVIGDTVRALATRAHRKGLELVCDVRDDVPDALIGDDGRLRQVLINLIGNAIKFTAQGEVVAQVEVDPSSPPSEADVVLRFAVRDTGIGVSRDKQAAIFRAFEQADTSTTRRYGGTGLGLTIAARLIALMGGSLTVDSEPGRGSTFSFAARFGRQGNAPQSVSPRPPVSLRDLRVLVVDDNAVNRHILDAWLRGWGVDSTVVGDGTAAMDSLWHAVASKRPHALMLLDARMPGTDGMTLAARIRERAELAATRIILLTSGDLGGDQARFGELRIEAHILKPVLQDELYETILRVMSRAGGELPAADGVAASPSPVPAAAVRSEAPLRVLVAEDNEFNSRVIQELLVRRGHHVQLASNGNEALRLVESDSFDLMLLDLHMPEKDGFEVIKAVRTRERSTGNHLPVVALTARSRPEDRERVLASGMDDFLAKPLRAASLWTTIERLGVSARTAVRPLLDPRAILEACADDAAILESLCCAFRRRLPPDMAAIEQAFRDRDALRLRDATHKLLAMVAVFSTAAGGVARDLEEHAARGKLDEAGVLVEKLGGMGTELLGLVGGLSIASLRAAVS